MGRTFVVTRLVEYRFPSSVGWKNTMADHLFLLKTGETRCREANIPRYDSAHCCSVN